MLAIVFLGGCTDLPEVATGCCGNGVLDPGEECDSRQPGCGAPVDGGSCEPVSASSGNACRLVCVPDGGVACAKGSLCGRDHVCRQPTGAFRRSAPIGNIGERFQILDADDDGVPDLIGLDGFHLNVYRNDGAGHFALSSSGHALYDPATRLVVGKTIAGEPPLLAALTPSGADLYSLAPGRPIRSVVVAPSRVDESGGPIEYLATFTLSPDIGGTIALYYQAATYQLRTVLVASDQAVESAIDLSMCGHSMSQAPEVGVATPSRAGSTLLILIDHLYPCFIPIVGAALPLDTAPLAPLLAKLRRPMVADFDGDGLLDALAVMDTVSGGLSIAVWLATPEGKFAPPIVVPVLAQPIPTLSDVIAGDFNGDRRADLASYPCVLTHQSFSPPDGGMPPGDGGVSPLREWFGLSGCVDPVLSDAPGAVDHVIAGDFNRDGALDIAYASTLGGDVSVCIGDGTGAHFTCDVVLTPLPGIDALLVGDINGDLVSDVVAASFAPSGVAGAAPGGIEIIPGRPLGLPDPTPIALPTLDGQLVALGGGPTDGIASELQIAIRAGSSLGVGLGRAAADANPVFPLPGGFFDARLIDARGNGVRDLLLLDSELNLDVYTGDGQGGFLPGLTTKTIVLPFDANGYGISDLHLADLGETAPVAVFTVQLIDINSDPANTGFWMARQNGDHYDATQLVKAVVKPMPSVVQDLDGDGIPELLLVDAGPPCHLQVAHFPAGGGSPSLTEAATFDCTGFGDLRLFLAPANRDQRLDLFVARDSTHYVYFPARSDGTFDVGGATLNPPLVIGASGTLEPFDFSPLNSWVGTTDIDGDGLADVVFNTPLGAVISFGDVGRSAFGAR